MICFFNKYKKSVQKHTDFFDNSFFNAVPDKPLATRNKSHNNQLCADLFHFISAYPVVSHFLRFAWQTTPGAIFSIRFIYASSFASSSICATLASFSAQVILTVLSRILSSLDFSNIPAMTLAAIGAHAPFSINATVLF